MLFRLSWYLDNIIKTLAIQEKKEGEQDNTQFLAAVFRLPFHVTCALFGIVSFHLQIERKYLSELEPKLNYFIQNQLIMTNNTSLILIHVVNKSSVNLLSPI